MAKLSLYTLLVLTFLGISGKFSLSKQKSKLIRDSDALAWHFKEKPLSIILSDAFQAGFLLKTYYLKLRVFYGFKSMRKVIIRTSREFYETQLPNRGMSIFRRSETNAQESAIPLPPGFLYVGNNTYGYWKSIPSGNKIWTFHKTYKDFPSLFMWGDFRPDLEFYKMSLFSVANSNAFYGMNNEFGSKGSITRKQFIVQTQDRREQKTTDIKKYIAKITRVPPWTLKGEKK